MNVPMFTQLPMHVSVPGAQPQNPPVQVCEAEQRLPQRPQFWASLANVILSRHLPSHHSWLAEHPAAPIPEVLAGGEGLGACFRVMHAVSTKPINNPNNKALVSH
jgi:hypothetical protein